MGSLSLTERDIQIVEMVHSYQGVTVAHVHQRFFAGKSRAASNRRVAKLEEAEYLLATRLPVLSGRGSGKAFVTLGPKGRQLVAASLGVPLSSLPHHALPTPLHLLHHVGIVSFHLTLELACEELGVVSLSAWQSETAIKRTRAAQHTGPADASSTLIPDAAFTLSYHGRDQQCVLEIDRGTTRLPRMQQKWQAYLAAQRRDGAKYPIFVVTTTPARMTQLHLLAEQEAKALSTTASVFYVTTDAMLAEDTILTAPIWRQGNATAPIALFPQLATNPVHHPSVA